MWVLICPFALSLLSGFGGGGIVIFHHHSRADTSMCLIERNIPSNATCTRRSTFEADSNAGRISKATPPIAGIGFLTNAPTQNARSDGSSAGGIGPKSKKQSIDLSFPSLVLSC